MPQAEHITLLDVMRNAKPTVLIGVSAQQARLPSR